MTYAELHKRSLQDRDAYWREQAQRIDWHRPFHKVCDTSQPPFTKWFVGGQLNLCHNAVDRHVPHRPDQPALIAEGVLPTNGARNVALVDGLWRDEALEFERVFHLFDEDSIGAARAAWRALGEREGVERRYWRQDENGRWAQVA